MASDSIATAMSHTVEILVTGWAITATAAVALLFSRNQAYRHALEQWEKALQIAQHAKLEAESAYKQSVYDITQAYRKKDRECEQLRSEKSAISESCKGLMQLITEKDEGYKRLLQTVKVGGHVPICTACKSGKLVMVNRAGLILQYCEDCIPF